MHKKYRILIVRTTALGDIVHTFPALMALRKAFPAAHIGWAVEKRFASLLSHITEIDAIHPIERKKGLGILIKDLKAIRSEKYDISIDFQGLLKSAVVCFASGASRRIGFSSENAREGAHLCYTRRAGAPDGKANITRLNLSLIAEAIESLSGKTPVLDVAFPTFTASNDRKQVEDLLESFGQKNKFALINPGGAWHSKLWGAHNYATLIEKLKKEFNLDTILTCFGSEKKLGDDINALLRNPAPIADALSYTQQAALSERARLAIGPDTGPLHIAHAVNCPTVFLFGASDSWRNTPSQNQGFPLQSPLDCTPCWKKTCPLFEETRCMQAITPDMIIEKIRGFYSDNSL